MILLIDNYDSFTYNLFQLTAGITHHPTGAHADGGPGEDVRVVRNDALTIGEIEALCPSHILLSPGPGYPKDAGICEEVIAHFAGKVPILGVCLGHQAICEVFGATISHAEQLMHGKKSRIRLQKDSIFAGLPDTIDAARYHSLIARRDTLPDDLIVIAEDNDIGEVMAVRHARFMVYGLQFHPESVLTPQGEIMMRNFLEMRGERE